MVADASSNHIKTGVGYIFNQSVRQPETGSGQ